MYCPSCFGNSLEISSSGVIHLAINGKRMDTGRFLFNKNKESLENIQEKLLTKIDEFFSWYSDFQNRDPISHLQVYTSDFDCSAGCKIPMTTKIGVTKILFDPSTIEKKIEDLGKKYGLAIKLNFQDS